ncbi:MAG: outer membrane beta-barrel protein [Syntrophaceae bacterium]|nr:outer membrane beta-barrel protein [Syntrophaceae bacterium]
MKKIVILAAVIFTMVAFSTAYAGNKAGDFSVGLSAGGYFFEGNQDYQDNIASGVRAGYNFTDNIGMEIFVNYVPSEFEEEYRDGDRNRVYVAGLEGIFNLMPENRFVPFIAVGLGAIHYTSGDDDLVPSKMIVDYGAGIKFFVTKDLIVRADVRHVLPIGDKDEYGDNPHEIHNDLMATFGFSYNFNLGGNK